MSLGPHIEKQIPACGRQASAPAKHTALAMTVT